MDYSSNFIYYLSRFIYSSEEKNFPIIFELIDGELKVRLSTEQINACKSMDDLKEAINSFL